MKYRFLLPLILLLALSPVAQGRKAQEGPKMVYQPDGTAIMATLRGDEFSHIMVTTKGQAIIQDKEGYYCYAYFDADGSMRSSGARVGDISVPAAVLRESASIPYEKIRENAALRRAAQPLEEENIVRRLSRRYSMAQTTTEEPTPATKHIIVILVNFKDVSFRYTKEEFQNLMTQPGYSYNGATGSAKDYLEYQFGGLFDFDIEVSSIVTVSKNRSYYGENDASGHDKHPEEMVVEACQLADAEIDFSLYDDDGDGDIDNVFVFFAGGDEAEYAGDDCIWAHSYYIYDGARQTVMLDGKRLNRYACGSELITFNSGKTYSMTPIGTFCHEYSHTLGLMDFYDTDYSDSGGTADALWEWTSLMDSGNQNNKGNTPPNYNAVEREDLGLLIPDSLPEGALNLESIDVSNTCYKVDGDVEGEYYLIECRRDEGWDAYIGGHGLLVYHVDRSSNRAGRSTTYNRTLTAAQRWYYNEVNANPSHQCVDLIEANPSATGKCATRSNSYCGDVFFPYNSYNSITPSGKTSFEFWSGAKVDLSVTGISYASGVASMSVSGAGSTLTPPKVNITSREAFQTAAVVNFESSFDFDGNATVKWGLSGKEKTTLEVAPYENGKYAVVLENLSPTTAYEVEILFCLNGIIGESATAKFTTASVSAKGRPYIYLKNVQRMEDNIFPSGSRFPLRIFNASDVDGILWFYNGKPISIGKDGYYTATAPGEMKAEIIHTDGTREFIAKKILIKQ